MAKRNVFLIVRGARRQTKTKAIFLIDLSRSHSNKHEALCGGWYNIFMLSRNKSVQREYEILDRLEAGIVLNGAEVKSVKKRGINFEGAFVKVAGGEALLINATIEIYNFSRPDSHEPKRTRKLLLHKKEIERIQGKLSQGSNLTLVPVSCYIKKSFIKLEIAVAKGRKTWEVKRVEQHRDEERRVQKELKEYLKS